MKEADRIKLIAPCGMNCSICMAYLREKNKCPGCREPDEGKPVTRVKCKIKTCEVMQQSNKKYCFECKEYPCSWMKRLDKRYRNKYAMSMIDNLEYIKQFGIRKFVIKEKEKWTCANCSKIICVHKENCIFCGYDWRLKI